MPAHERKGQTGPGTPNRPQKRTQDKPDGKEGQTATDNGTANRKPTKTGHTSCFATGRKKKPAKTAPITRIAVQ